MTTTCPVCGMIVSCQWPRKGDGRSVRLKMHNTKRQALISGAIRPFKELCKGSMQIVSISGKIPVDALTRKAERIAPPITVKFEQAQLTDDEIKAMAAQLEADIQQALLKLLEDNGGRIPYNDQTSEAAQKIVAEAYNRICEQYGLVTISVNVEL